MKWMKQSDCKRERLGVQIPDVRLWHLDHAASCRRQLFPSQQSIEDRHSLSQGMGQCQAFGPLKQWSVSWKPLFYSPILLQDRQQFNDFVLHGKVNMQTCIFYIQFKHSFKAWNIHSNWPTSNLHQIIPTIVPALPNLQWLVIYSNQGWVHLPTCRVENIDFPNLRYVYP